VTVRQGIRYFLRWLALLLAVLVFLVPVAYLRAIWWRKSPPTQVQVDRASVEIVEGAYHVTLPGGFKYVVNANLGGPDEARRSVREQARDEHAAFSHAWSNFWFLLASAFGASAILILSRRFLTDEEPRSMREAEKPLLNPAEHA